MPGRAALASARFDEADDDLRAAIDLFALHDDEIGAADATVMLARSRFERGDIDGEGPLLQQAIAVLEAHAPGPALAHAASRMAGHLWVVGDLQACVTWSERALTLAREMGLFSEQVLAMQYRGASRSKLGDEAGLDDMREALRIGVEHGLGEETAVAYNNYAYELWYQRGAAESQPVWEEMAAFCEARGLATSYAWARGGSLEPLFDAGDWDRVLGTAAWLRAWDDEHGGETQPGSVAIQFQGWVTLRRGDHDTAKSCAKELMDRALQLGTAEYLSPAFLLAAEVACAEDDQRHDARAPRRVHGVDGVAADVPHGLPAARGAPARAGRRPRPGRGDPRRRHRGGRLDETAPALLRHRAGLVRGDMGRPRRRARAADGGRRRVGVPTGSRSRPRSAVSAPLAAS